MLAESHLPSCGQRAYLAWCRLCQDGQAPAEDSWQVGVSGWLSENLVACQEWGLQLSSFLLKDSARDSGTAHRTWTY